MSPNTFISVAFATHPCKMMAEGCAQSGTIFLFASKRRKGHGINNINRIVKDMPIGPST